MKFITALLIATALFLAAPVVAQADTGDGTFVMRCDPTANLQEDPVVTPGPIPTLSAHLHTFSGNTTTRSNSTYESMQAGGSSCRFSMDTAGYWFDCLINPANEGVCVNPRFTFFYYKNMPVSYRTTTPFPADLKMVIHDGNANTGFWDCFDKNPPGSFTTSIPRCTTDDLQVRLKAPNCWDGQNLDTVTRDVSNNLGTPTRNPFTGLAYPNDHISHVVKFTNNACPADHPVKLPMGNFFVRWAPPAGGPGWHLSDGTLKLHFDFWNTWQQPALNQLVSKCLSPVGKNCGQVTNANFSGL